MQEIKKKTIVIASVLKPVDDTRMYEKMGSSLVRTGRFDVHILGYPTQRKIEAMGVRFHDSKPFSRISLSRIMQPLRVCNSILEIRPSLVIITTHELLSISLLIKLLTGCKIVYDVQENYYKNILYTNTFARWVRPWLAIYVRAKEVLVSPFINYFILAEYCYKEELKFTQHKNLVLENKLQKPITCLPKKSRSDGLINLVFSGTLAHTTGIFSALAFTKKLHALDDKIHLTIIGFCPQHVIYNQIKNEIEGLNFITLIGGNEIVPHDEILKTIRQADFGIIAYPANKSTQDRIPTKLFEYLGCTLPILLVEHPAWTRLCKPYEACISINFDNPDVVSILHAMKTKEFYTSLPQDVFWQSDDLISLIDGLA